MENQELEHIGETLRRLGHERRETVERIVSETGTNPTGTHSPLYRELDQISERCIHLMEQQRSLIRDQLGG